MTQRQQIWLLGLLSTTILLVFAGQSLLERPEPQLGAGVLLLALAGGMVMLVNYPRLGRILGQLPMPMLLLPASSVLFLLALATHARPNPPIPLVVVCWLGAISTFLSACWSLDRHHNDVQPLSLQWTRVDTLLLATVSVVGLLLRTIALDRAPLTMNGDEGAMAMEAVRVLDGTITNPFTTGWLSHPTLWFYLQSVSLRLTGQTLFGVRLLPAILGTITVGLTYTLGRLLFARCIATIAALLLATYHFHIHFSRLGLNNIADPLFGVLVFTCLTVALRTRRRLMFGITGIALGMGLYFYHGARLFIPLIAMLGTLHVIVGVMRSRSLRPQLSNWHVVVLGAIGLILAAGPLLQTFAGSPGTFSARFAIEGVTQEWLRHESTVRGESIPAILFDQFKRAALAFNAYPDRSDFYDQQRPLLWGIAAGLMLVGLVVAVAHLNQWRYQILVAWFVLAILLGGMLLKVPPKSPRYITLAPVVCFFIAFAIDRIANAAQLFNPTRRRVAPIVAGLLVCGFAVGSLRGYFGDYIQREQLGGGNTHTANAMAAYLKHQPPGTRVWFLGPPRMYYHGFPLIEFLAGEMEASDILESIQSVDEVPPAAVVLPTVYIALPERREELNFIQQQYPGGQVSELIWPLQPETVAYAYTVPPSR